MPKLMMDCPKNLTCYPLKRSVQDFVPDTSRKLPLIQEVLSRAEENVEGDFLVYTNLDIILTPHFYSSVVYYLNQGHDALVINRQRVSQALENIEDLPAVFAEKGMIHPGFDCFVFKRDLLEKIDMGNICLGIPFIGGWARPLGFFAVKKSVVSWKLRHDKACRLGSYA